MSWITAVSQRFHECFSKSGFSMASRWITIRVNSTYFPYASGRVYSYLCLKFSKLIQDQHVAHPHKPSYHDYQFHVYISFYLLHSQFYLSIFLLQSPLCFPNITTIIIPSCHFPLSGSTHPALLARICNNLVLLGGTEAISGYFIQKQICHPR